MKEVKLESIQCDLCGNLFQFGPHRYEGKFLSNYQMNVCKTCLLMNSDGIGPKYEEKFVNHLTNRNIKLPKRNADKRYLL